MSDRRNSAHIAEAQLELLLLDPDSLDQETRDRIKDHLSACAECALLCSDLTEMHRIIVDGTVSRPTAEDLRTADRIGKRGGLVSARGVRRVSDDALEGYAEVVEPTGMAIIRRIAGYIRTYPVRAAAAGSFMVLMAVTGLLILRPIPDTNPVYAKFDKGRLHVFNKEGDTIWTHIALGAPDQGSSQETVSGARRLLMVEDVDGDGANEVLVTGNEPGGTFATDTLYCLDGRGERRWTAGGGPVIQLGAFEYTKYANWKIRSWFVMHLPGEETPRLFSTAQAIPHMTSKLSELDPTNGRELRAYWHSGGIIYDAICDLAGDSTPEIVLTAINNGYRSASVIVLDPRSIAGHGTTTPEYTPRGMPRARELYYILLKPTDVAEVVVTHLYNSTALLRRIDSTTIQVHTDETLEETVKGGIVYTFGKQMKLLSVHPNDPFVKTREKLVREGKLHARIDDRYLDDLRTHRLVLVGDTTTQ